MKNEITVAVLQLSVTERKEENLKHLEEAFDSPELTEVDLVAVPEMFLCPYETKKFPLYAEKEGEASWKFCSDLAKKHHVYLAAGSMPEADEDGRIYNTAYVFDRDGKQIARHRKVHLFDINIEGGQYYKESETLSAGNQITVFDTEFGKIGLCICFDLRFGEMCTEMALRGSRLILVPAAFNMTTGPAHWELLFRQRAVDSQSFFVGISTARDENAGYVSWGHSIVTDPWGTVRMQLSEKEETGIVKLDLSMAEKLREELPILKNTEKRY